MKIANTRARPPRREARHAVSSDETDREHARSVGNGQCSGMLLACSLGERIAARRETRQRRWPSESPIAWAFWRRAPAVRFMALAMEVTGVFFFE